MEGVIHGLISIANGLNGHMSPVGSIVMWAPATGAPAGWERCKGQAVSRTDPAYSQLFALIGTTYGVGDGSTTFNLPNFDGRVPVGYDSSQTEFDAVGETGGAKTVTLTASQIPAHTHTMTLTRNNCASGSGGADGWGVNGGASGMGAQTTDNGTGGGQAHNNLQPYLTVQFIIRCS